MPISPLLINKGISCKHFSKSMKLVLVAFSILLLTGLVCGQQTATDLFNKGADLSNRGQYEAAIKAYDEAIKLDPKLFVAWYNKGNDLDTLGEFNESVEAYDEAIKLDPTDVASWSSKGAVLGKLGEYNESIAAFDEALRLNPDDVRTWNNKGTALGLQGMYRDNFGGRVMN